jgi:hypothetical protein
MRWTTISARASSLRKRKVKLKSKNDSIMLSLVAGPISLTAALEHGIRTIPERQSPLRGGKGRS